ncbi:transposase [Leptospira noguchii]|uniref:transposase n=1 Tax=Leptospira noguchii TaxID=28182 RepID=UPI000B0A6879|nr:transposase [Leptospira noguchii]UOG59744.1 transposase [Leptospira noguchii]
MDFEIYREELESMSRSGTKKGGRPPYDGVLMFKIVILQKLYNLSDHQDQRLLLVSKISWSWSKRETTG